jgi:hypothetical protein
MRCQRPRNRRPLLLASGKLARVGVGAVAEADLGEESAGLLNSFRAGNAVNMNGRFDYVAEHRHVVPQIEALKDHGDAAAEALGLMARRRRAIRYDCEVFFTSEDFTAVRHFQEIEAAQKRALPGTGRAHDRYHLALIRDERDAR